MSVRAPSVAGFFYPADPVELEETVRRLIEEAPASNAEPRALIAPHAGYVYSGPIAATGYSAVQREIERVVLLGPAHRYPFRGVATHSADRFATPLGEIEVEPTPHLPTLDDAHLGEHSIEAQLPFLQMLFGDFTLVPVLVGEATPAEACKVIEALWGDEKTLVVISSDLSHHRGYDKAVKIDKATAKAIEDLLPEAIGPEEACGCCAIGGMLALGAQRKLSATTLDLRNSGDTAGGREEVVGYGAFSFE